MANDLSTVAGEIARLRDEVLPRLLAEDPTRRDEWLRLLYESYSNRFLSDNDRIWSTGAIMIPLSLAPFAVLPAIDTPQAIHFWILGLASLTVYVAWLVIADGHRQFQDKSLAWTLAIQETIGLTKIGPPKLGQSRLTMLLTVRGMRYAILVELVAGWIVAAMYWPPAH